MLTKFPLRVADGRAASVTNPDDWCDYETALAAVRANPDLGLGFVLTADLGISCVDLDNPNDAKFLPEQIAAIKADHLEIYKSV